MVENIDTVNITIYDVSLRLIISGILGIAIGATYTFAFRGITYSESFRNTIILICIILSGIIVTIGSNIALSLGLVGSLSIIRFRAVVKDVMDMLYLFWSIGIGIACGAGQFHIAILMFFIVLAFLIISKLGSSNKLIGVDNRFILKIKYLPNADIKNIEKILTIVTKKVTIRSSFTNPSQGTIETNYMLTFAKDNVPSVNDLIPLKDSKESIDTFQLTKADSMNVL